MSKSKINTQIKYILVFVKYGSLAHHGWEGAETFLIPVALESLI